MNSIPKTIHYCWFGGNPLTEKEISCIESWKKFLPDYEIVRWDESNFDVRCCDYVSEAYDAKKWAFVSDYARFKILYDNGGLYFDTDVEVIRPMDDIIAAGPFMGFETDCAGSGNNIATKSGGGTVTADLGLSANPGLGLSANPGLGLYKHILDSYAGDHFVKADGSMDKTTVVKRVTDILCGYGLRDVPGVQHIAGVTIYPSEYFNPKSYETGEITLTKNTRSIHHFSMSWFTKSEKFQHRITARLLRTGFSPNTSGHIAAVITTARFLDVKRAVRHFTNR